MNEKLHLVEKFTVQTLHKFHYNSFFSIYLSCTSVTLSLALFFYHLHFYVRLQNKNENFYRCILLGNPLQGLYHSLSSIK